MLSPINLRLVLGFKLLLRKCPSGQGNLCPIQPRTTALAFARLGCQFVDVGIGAQARHHAAMLLALFGKAMPTSVIAIADHNDFIWLAQPSRQLVEQLGGQLALASVSRRR